MARPVVAMETLVRRGKYLTQTDFHIQPVWVEGGSEDDVLVSSGRLTSTAEFVVGGITSFLGVMPEDVVEMAVDVVDDSGIVIYTRSVHKETAGIYDAWHKQDTPYSVQNLTITITCRVNGNNRDGNLKAFFEGLVRIETCNNG